MKLIHCHSEYSIGDGMMTCDKLVKTAVEKGFDAITLTDHGVVGGHFAFLEACKKYNVKPALGCEVYFQPELEKTKANQDRTSHHLVLIAKTKKGYSNIIGASSEAWVNGMYYKPRLDWNILKKYRKDIIVTTACMGGVLAPYLNQSIDDAMSFLRELYEIYGKENVFVEVQLIENEGNLEYLKKISQLKQKYPDIRLILGQDSHYPNEQDWDTHEVFLNMQSNMSMRKDDRRKYPTRLVYIKSKKDIQELYMKFHFDKALQEEYFKEAIVNTNALVEMVEEYDIASKPVFIDVEKYGFHEPLNELLKQGFKYRGFHLLSNEERQKYTNRLLYELKIVKDFGLDKYFLATRVLVELAKQNKLLVGPGRGSSAGVLINYLLGNTNVDPLKYGLLFERFMNPDRKELPDIDIDYSHIDVLNEKLVETFGSENVSRVATYSTYQYKGLVRDLGRVFEYPLQEINALSKKFDGIKSLDKMSIEEVKTQVPEFSAWLKRHSSDNVEKHIRKLHNVIRHKGIHAAGVLITNNPIWKHFPVEVQQGEMVSAYTEGGRERALLAIGGVKFDALGLKTLRMHLDTIKNIAIRRNEDPEDPKWLDMVDTSKINDHDEKVFETIFQTGDTIDIFQFESATARRIVDDVKPDCVGDLCAINALNRPGPLMGGYDLQYSRTKHGEQERELIHPVVDKILDETYGTLVYQEQVIRMAKELGDLTDAEAELFRKVVFKLDTAKGKDDMSVRQKMIVKIKNKFFKNSQEKGMSEDEIQKLWDRIQGFLAYAFNKSHSLSYAMVAYVSAWLKTYYPIEWYCAYLNNIIGDPDKIKNYIRYLDKKGIEIIPPKFEYSNLPECSIVDDKKIALGINVLKNASGDVVSIVQKYKDMIRNFMDFFVFMINDPEGKVNKRTIDALIKIGYFDNLSTIGNNKLSRGELLVFYEQLNSMRGKFKKVEATRNEDGEYELSRPIDESLLKEIYTENVDKIKEKYQEALNAEVSEFDKYRVEMEVMQFSVEDHPLLQYSNQIDELKAQYENGHIICLAEITNVKKKMTQKGRSKRPYATVDIEDVQTGNYYKIMFWEQDLKRHNPEEGDYGIMIIQHPHPIYGTSQLAYYTKVNE